MAAKDWEALHKAGVMASGQHLGSCIFTPQEVMVGAISDHVTNWEHAGHGM